jgi:hypothetical protein
MALPLHAERHCEATVPPWSSLLCGAAGGTAGGAVTAEDRAQRTIACLGVAAALLLLFSLLMAGLLLEGDGGEAAVRPPGAAYAGGDGLRAAAADDLPRPGQTHGRAVSMRGYDGGTPRTLVFHLPDLSWARRGGFRSPDLEGVALETTVGCSVQCSVHASASTDPMTVLRGADGDAHPAAAAAVAAAGHGHPALHVSLLEDTRTHGVFVHVRVPEMHLLANGEEGDGESTAEDGRALPAAREVHADGAGAQAGLLPPSEGIRLRGCSVVLTVVG